MRNVRYKIARQIEMNARALDINLISYRQGDGIGYPIKYISHKEGVEHGNIDIAEDWFSIFKNIKIPFCFFDTIPKKICNVLLPTVQTTATIAKSTKALPL